MCTPRRAAQMSPAMQDLVGQFDMDSPAMKEQLAQLGTSPDQVRDTDRWHAAGDGGRLISHGSMPGSMTGSCVVVPRSRVSAACKAV